eukprot:3429597-Pleurochrysis_carterae.AAC.1
MRSANDEYERFVQESLRTRTLQIFRAANVSQEGMEEDELTRRVLDAIFPTGMRVEDARAQLEDIHKFVIDEEE